MVVKATAPKMDRNGYFFYATSTARKKRISLMQPRPPRVAFAEDKRRPGLAERISAPPPAVGDGRAPMTHRAPSDAPRARLYTQLESYQPRYHTIRESSDKRVESDRRRRRDTRIAGPQPSQRSHVRIPVVPQMFLSGGKLSCSYAMYGEKLLICHISD
ncbi:unnamed protein product, partial [Iphiclides podalirius]